MVPSIPSGEIYSGKGGQPEPRNKIAHPSNTQDDGFVDGENIWLGVQKNQPFEKSQSLGMTRGRATVPYRPIQQRTGPNGSIATRPVQLRFFRLGNLDSTERASWKRLSHEGHGFSRAVNSCALDGFTGCGKAKFLKGTAFRPFI